jgi:hypothetical protein
MFNPARLVFIDETCTSTAMVRSCSLGVALSLSSETKRLGQLAQAAHRAPSWMTTARGPDWRKFGIV